MQLALQALDQSVHTLSLTHTLTLSLSHTHTLTPSLYLSHTRTHTLRFGHMQLALEALEESVRLAQHCSVLSSLLYYSQA